MKSTEEKPRNPWLILFSVALGLFMVVVDVTILNIALPTLADDMGASLAAVQWTLIGYSLVLAGLVPFFGRISDVIGRKRLFLTGLLVFGASSAAAAASPSVEWLIGARLAQAVGGAIISANTLAIITDTFPAGKRGIAMGVQSILISGGAAFGPVIGGVLVTNFTWRAVFLINVPIGLAAATLGALVLPSLKSHRTMEPVDWPGAGLLAGGLAMFLLGVTKGPEWAWSETAFALIGAGIVILLLFVVRELTARYPLVDLSLFKVREFAAGQTAGLFAMMSLASMMFLFPFYWQGIRGYEAQEAGLLMLPIPMTLMVLAPISGRLSDRWGSRGIATVGLLTIITGLFLLSQLTPDMPVWQVLVRLMVFGAGIGMFIAPNNNGVMSAVPGHKRGVAAGLLGMFRFTGQSVGVALGGTVFALFATAGAGSAFNLESLPSPEMMTLMADDPEMLAAFRSAFVDGLTGVALAAIPFAAVAAWLSFLRGSKPGSGPDESPAEEARDRAVAEAD